MSERLGSRLWRWGKRLLPHAGESALVVGTYFAYMYNRKLAISDFETMALDHARRMISMEQSLGAGIAGLGPGQRFGAGEIPEMGLRHHQLTHRVDLEPGGFRR